ncbi:MAG TPA: glycosyltransferase family 4 protein [Microbacterium sp.]|nr:glycosyltransferase family 4 protein [Microbacterium sp.]
MSRDTEFRMPEHSVAVSSAFDENAIRAIAQRASRHGILTRRAIRDQAPLLSLARGAARVLPRSKTISGFVAKQSARVATGALPEDVRLSPGSEFIRVLGGRVRSPLTHTLGNATWKVAYDRAARHVDFGDARTLISMPGSSLETFTRNSDRRLVLHEIDAHPRVRNERLEAFYGARRAKAETYPDWFVDRIETELDLADDVLVPGRVVAGQMRSNGVEDSKIIQIPYGVDPGVFRPPTEQIPTRRARPRVVFTGQICLRKGVGFLLEAVKGLQLDLVLVGSVFDRQLVRALPSNVRLLGTLSATQLARLYAESDAFVLPSIEDNFALVVTEAEAAGLPVITTFETGSHELLGPAHTILRAGDVASLRDALTAHEMLAWDERRENADLAGSRHARSWDDYGDAVLREVSTP